MRSARMHTEHMTISQKAKLLRSLSRYVVPTTECGNCLGDRQWCRTCEQRASRCECDTQNNAWESHRLRELEPCAECDGLGEIRRAA